jgi:hypothetical protein
MVGGEPAQVVDGSYRRTLEMTAPSQTISISAQANGYAPGAASTTVQYSPEAASRIAAVEASTGVQAAGSGLAPSHGQSSQANTATTSTQSTPTRPSAAGAATGATAANHAGATSTAASSTSATKTSTPAKPTAPAAHKATATQHKTAAKHSTAATHSTATKHTTAAKHNSSAKHNSAGKHNSSAKHSSATKHKTAAKHNSSTKHKSSANHRATAKHKASGKHTARHHARTHHRRHASSSQIRKLWIQGCEGAARGGQYGSYCRCTYAHLSHAGSLRSAGQVTPLIRKLRGYENGHRLSTLPRGLQRAVTACAGKLPHPLGATTGLTRLPELAYGQPSLSSFAGLRVRPVPYAGAQRVLEDAPVSPRAITRSVMALL